MPRDEYGTVEGIVFPLLVQYLYNTGISETNLQRVGIIYPEVLSGVSIVVGGPPRLLTNCDGWCIKLTSSRDYLFSSSGLWYAYVHYGSTERQVQYVGSSGVQDPCLTRDAGPLLAEKALS